MYKNRLLTLLHQCDAWPELRSHLTGGQSDTAQKLTLAEAGKIFEVFCKYYFLAEPTVKNDYRNVWLYDEVPQPVKERLGLGAVEHGVDLVLEDTGGKFTALQCKFREEEKSRLSWTKDKIGNLFGYAGKANYFAVFTNASELDHVSKSRSEHFTFYNISDLLHVAPTTFRAIEKLLAGEKPLEKPKLTPFKHQTEAIEEALKYYKKHDRGQLIFPCGAGKTYTALWLKERLKAKRTLVLVPSLALLRQIKNQWAEQRRAPYAYICVCSEKDIAADADSTRVHTYEIGGVVTTDHREIRNFLAASHENKVIFSTYQSLSAVTRAVRSSKLHFDFVICDEAHKTTGPKTEGFSLVHDNRKLPAKKRLYMTATPRVLSAAAKSRLGEDEEYLCDMSNPAIYGEEIFRLTFKEAIDRGILVDYKIIAVGVTDKKLKQYLEKRKFVSAHETIDEVASNYALDLVMAKYKAFHAISYHSRVKSAEKFSERHRKMFGSVLSDHVNGAQTTSFRSLALKAFDQSKRAVLSNARCLVEGIDLPSIDMVYFCDPKNSKIDIVQASGRALRRDHSRNKRLGFIVVPIFHAEKNAVEDAIESSIFKNLVQVVRALCDQDERLREEITKLVYEKGRRRISKVEVSVSGGEQEKVISLIGFESRLKKALFDQILEKSAMNWDVQYQYLIAFRKKYPDRWPSFLTEFPKGNKLGSWCNNQRQRYKKGVLPKEQIALLEKIGFLWVAEDVWAFQYENLKLFVQRHHRCPNSSEMFPKGNKLGKWCGWQRYFHKLNKLSEERIQLLEKIGFRWEEKDIWTPQYDYLIRFINKYHRFPSFLTEFPKGNKLGSWCNAQRQLYKTGKLTKDRVELLEKLGFRWSREDAWQINCEKLKSFLKTHRRFPRSTNTEEIKLSRWCVKQRSAYKNGKLSKDRISKLNQIKFRWVPEEIWPLQYEHLKQFIRMRHRLPTNAEEYPLGNKLGVWCTGQRQLKKKGKLSSARIQLLEKVGFRWEKEDAWQINCEKLKCFLKTHRRFPSFAKTQEIKLSRWCVSQRSAYKNSELSKKRISMLEKMGFRWQVEDSWLPQYKYLKQFMRRYHRFPSISAEFPKGNKLGRWCAGQRQHYKKNKLSQDHIKLLEKIGFQWRIGTSHNRTPWPQQYKNLNIFIRMYHCRPSTSTEFPKGNKLGLWCANQRQKYKKGQLSKERIQLLERIGFLWSKEDTWSLQYDHLKRFVRKFRHFPSFLKEFPKGNRMGGWCNHQRQKYKRGQLSKERIKLLEIIGFEWKKTDAWLTQYKHLKQFMRRYHRFPNVSDEFPKGNKLGVWCVGQRQRYKKSKLSQNRIRLLEKMGFKWKRKDSWLPQYEYLKQFISKYHYCPPVLMEFPKGNKLGNWCHAQRQKYKQGKLSKERIKLLEKIGFWWIKENA